MPTDTATCNMHVDLLRASGIWGHDMSLNYLLGGKCSSPPRREHAARKVAVVFH